MKAKYFFGSVMVVAFALLKAGAPFSSVALGVALAGLWGWRNMAREKRLPRI
jgi:hypothetical protein